MQIYTKYLTLPNKIIVNFLKTRTKPTFQSEKWVNFYIITSSIMDMFSEDKSSSKEQKSAADWLPISIYNYSYVFVPNKKWSHLRLIFQCRCNNCINKIAVINVYDKVKYKRSFYTTSLD